MTNWLVLVFISLYFYPPNIYIFHKYLILKNFSGCDLWPSLCQCILFLLDLTEARSWMLYLDPLPPWTKSLDLGFLMSKRKESGKMFPKVSCRSNTVMIKNSPSFVCKDYLLSIIFSTQKENNHHITLWRICKVC